MATKCDQSIWHVIGFVAGTRNRYLKIGMLEDYGIWQLIFSVSKWMFYSIQTLCYGAHHSRATRSKQPLITQWPDIHSYPTFMSHRRNALDLHLKLLYASTLFGGILICALWKMMKNQNWFFFFLFEMDIARAIHHSIDGWIMEKNVGFSATRH